ncbi:KTSC domain-containing protein [Bradyrhizobium manausense]|uniref:KTSC domain-containing protein n=1 Tax=Bradyrhizobium TaxID=374 RepID=UPI001BAB0772|nr:MULTISPECIES: KTSC domain-containing protein [Bradyrhizobium]MBR0829364.1 KTSC domain-containing protein [Bradyrhizobium manausense]UVO25746.1 KTSC domain-containing protein [Bradyrhizobium arachidis]
MVRTIALLLSQLLTAPIVSETVDITGRGEVDLASFECRDINRSTVLQRVCYDREQHDLIVAIDGAYDRYCGVPARTVDGLMGAPSMGQFFNQNIRRQISGDRYDCPVPRRT